MRESHVIEYGLRRALVTAAVIVATMLEIVDTTIVNVALPNIQGNFGVAVDQGVWIVTGYIIANVIVIPISPWLQVRFGRRAYYIASIALFTAASLMCGFAGSFGSLVFWRIVQGLGGGGLLSTSQAILRETYPLNEQGKATGIFSMGVIVGPAIGPLLGGIITDQLSWRWAFFINIPLGIFAAALAYFILRNPAKPQKSKLDWIGLAFLAAGLGAMQYVFDQGQTKDWFEDPSVRWLTLTSIVSLAAFVVWTLRSKIPVVDLHVLKYRAVVTGSILGAVLGVSLYGSIVILPQYVQNSLGFTASGSGELILIRAIFVALMTPFIAIVAGKNLVDPRILIGTGFTLVGVSNWLMANATTSDSSFWTFGISLATSGLGLGMIFVPLSISVLSAVPAEAVPKAAAFFNLSRQIGGSVATAALVTILTRSDAIHQTALAAGIAHHVHSVQTFLVSGSLQQVYSMVAGQALVLSYADTSRITALISICLAPLVLLLRRPKAQAASTSVE
ncbi:MAG: DHA2 family efflux MFS transporter permease subunit [Candidatus Baltobacteraceae bacterium]